MEHEEQEHVNVAALYFLFLNDGSLIECKTVNALRRALKEVSRENVKKVIKGREKTLREETRLVV